MRSLARDIISSLTGSSDCGAFVCDSDGRVVVWNGRCREATGYSAGEAVGRYCYEVFCARGKSGEPFCGSFCPARSATPDACRADYAHLRIAHRDGAELEIWLRTIQIPVGRVAAPFVFHLFRPWIPSGPPLGPNGGPYAGDRRSHLTARQLEVMLLVAAGFDVGEIAARLDITHNTVRNHIAVAHERLHARTNAQAVLALLAYVEDQAAPGRTGGASFESSDTDVLWTPLAPFR